MAIEYKPGQTVPESGIYRVVHDRNHLPVHEVTAVKNERFPPCRNCGDHPRFTLARPALHLKEHSAFR